jgi:hypothetical protein
MNSLRRASLLGVLVGYTCLTGSLARAQADGGAPAACVEPQPVDEYQFLRRLSFDLRAQPPTMAEYAQIDQGQSALNIAAAWITHWDPSQPAPDPSHEAFRQRMRHYHELMLWPVPTNVMLTSVSWELYGDPDSGVLFLNQRDGVYFTHNPDWNPPPAVVSNRSALCDGTRPQPDDGYYPEVDPANPAYHPIPQVDILPDGGTAQWVGYRNVTPYWSFDGGSVKVCAYEAQQAPVAWRVRLSDGGTVYLMQPDAGGYTGVVADACQGAGPNNTWCGCGANLQWCWGGTTMTDVVNDMTEQLLRVTDQVTVAGKPYSDILTGNESYVSGRLAYWKQILDADNSGVYNSTLTLSDPGEYFVPVGQLDGRNPGELPATSYTDTTWYAVTRPAGHAGVVTLPAYLLRFQTNRSRANRFRSAFLCNYFIPPNQLTDAPPQCDEGTSDLMRKCNCRLCHATLEPLAAHWGRFGEAGESQLGPDAGFPTNDPTCKPNAKTGVPTTNGRCTRYYITDHSFDVLADGGSPDGLNHDYTGLLRPYVYSDIHLGPDPITGQIVQVIQNHIEAGPQLLRTEYIDDASHEFAHCAVKSLFSYLMQRDMRVDGADNDEAALLEQLASDFVGDESDPYDFNKLVFELLSLPQYRRIR